MSENYKPVKGDRVRVVLEGEVASTGYGRFCVGSYEGGMRNQVFPDAEHVVSVEKIEPPVEVFKPGDVVRGKISRAKILLGSSGGYMYFATDEPFGSWHGDFSPYGEFKTASDFTSKDYERVNLS